MKESIKKLLHKILCVLQRIQYKILFFDIKINPWHLSGTLYCREYKIQTLEIINKIKPDFYIDIGCGLGEILNKVDINKSNKIGFDIDKRLNKAIKRTNPQFYFTSNKKNFFKLLRRKVKGGNFKIIVSLLNFSHTISDEEFLLYLTTLNEILGPYILITDSIFDNSKEYKYSHKKLLDKQENIIQCIEKIDDIRSLYCISFKNKVIA